MIIMAISDAYSNNGLYASSVHNLALRLAFAKTGVVSGCAIAQQSPLAMTVQATLGVVYLAKVRIGVAANASIAITAAHATLDRYDLISVNSSGVYVYTVGTASATAVPPEIPAANVPIAIIYVAATAATIADASIYDLRITIEEPRFNIGGDGSDGDLTIASAATTTISTASEPVIKNYNNLTIDAGGTFTKTADSNPLIIKVKGNLVVNGLIDMNAKGCPGATGTYGRDGKGLGGGSARVNSMGLGGSAPLFPFAPLGGVIFCGSGGGNGVDAFEPAGDGGTGAGSIYFEVLGNVTLGATADFDFRGGVGQSTAQGGGGGGSGLCILGYGGTYTDSGATTRFTGGAGGVGLSGIGGGGGAGYYDGLNNVAKTGGAGGAGLFKYYKILAGVL